MQQNCCHLSVFSIRERCKKTRLSVWSLAPSAQCSVTPGRGHTMSPSCSLLLLLAASWPGQAASFVIDQEQLTALLQQYLSLRWSQVWPLTSLAPAISAANRLIGEIVPYDFCVCVPNSHLLTVG